MDKAELLQSVLALDVFDTHTHLVGRQWWFSFRASTYLDSTCFRG